MAMENHPFSSMIYRVYIHLSWHMAGPIVDCSTTFFYSYKPFMYSQYIPIILLYYYIPMLFPFWFPVYSQYFPINYIPIVFPLYSVFSFFSY